MPFREGLQARSSLAYSCVHTVAQGVRVGWLVTGRLSVEVSLSKNPHHKCFGQRGVAFYPDVNKPTNTSTTNLDVTARKFARCVCISSS